MDSSNIRVGLGFDTHPFDSEREKPLILGGVTFEGPGLDAHSDGDVVLHALVDSILSPAGLGDIGSMFSDQADENRDRSSVEFLKIAVKQVTSLGWKILNSDCVVVADQPKIAPQAPTIQAKVSDILGAPFTMKGKRTEGVAHQRDAMSCHITTLLLAPGGE